MVKRKKKEKKWTKKVWGRNLGKKETKESGERWRKKETQEKTGNKEERNEERLKFPKKKEKKNVGTIRMGHVARLKIVWLKK